MIFSKNTRNTFFYFFALYSALFLIFEYFNILILLQLLSYIGLTVFFAYTLAQYYAYLVENKTVVDKKWKTKKEKEIVEEYHTISENFKEGIVILLLVVCVFVAIGNREGNQMRNIGQKNTMKNIKADVLLHEASYNEPVMIVDDIPSDISLDMTGALLEQNTEIEQKEGSMLDINELQEVIGITEEPEVVENIIDVPGKNLMMVSDSHDESLSLEKNFETTVGDLYELKPFTKHGSDFYNILQLQRVLQKLGYYTGLADGGFNIETKSAVATMLVRECNWPAGSTTGVFGKMAKSCLDGLYISADTTENE